jgi:DeoR family transcriptional regulator, glucitol operon repressor
MTNENRKIHILNQLAEHKYMKVTELAKILNTSPSTIRRDLNEMSKTGLLIRHHGGASIIESTLHDMDYDIKVSKNYNLKFYIAKEAAKLIYDNETIFLGSSSLTEIMAPYITAKNLTIITNSLNIIRFLKNKTDCKLIILGGIFIPKAETIEGLITNKQLSSMHYDKSFLGANGIDFNYGISSITEFETNSKIIAIRNSTKTFFLCEHTKFNKSTTYKVTNLNEITGIITDDKIPKDVYDKYKTKCKLILAKVN